MGARAGAAGAAACLNLLRVLPIQFLPLTPIIGLAWHLLQQLLLLDSPLAGMQACLGQFPEGLFLVVLCSPPMQGQAGALLSAQLVPR